MHDNTTIKKIAHFLTLDASNFTASSLHNIIHSGKKFWDTSISNLDKEIVNLSQRVNTIAQQVLTSAKEVFREPSITPPEGARSLHIGEASPIYEKTYYPSDCFSNTHGHNFRAHFSNSTTDRIALFCNGVMNTKYNAIETTKWMEEIVKKQETASHKKLYDGFTNLYMESRGLIQDSIEACKSFFCNLTQMEKKGADAYESLLQMAMQYELQTGHHILIDHYIHSRGGVNYAHIRKEVLRRNPAYKAYMGNIYTFGSTLLLPDEISYWAKGDLIPILNPKNIINILNYHSKIKWAPHPWQHTFQAHEMSGSAYRKAFQEIINQAIRAA